MISFERLGITPPRLIWAGCLVTLLYAWAPTIPTNISRYSNTLI